MGRKAHKTLLFALFRHRNFLKKIAAVPRPLCDRVPPHPATSCAALLFGAEEVYANGSTKKRRGMPLYTNGWNIRLGNYIRFTSLTMYNMHIFYLASLMFSRNSYFLISDLHAVNTKIKGQPHWVVLLDLCQLSCLSFVNKLYHWPTMYPA